MRVISDGLDARQLPQFPLDLAAFGRLIESSFATVRLRTRVTKGPGSRAAGLAMAFKLIEAARDRRRAVNRPQLVALVRAGARFEKGVIVERQQQDQEAVA